MSSFGGKIQEIPNISVDRFDDENVKSEAFFLSHCHTDHMIGLSNYHFQEMLVQNNKFLYCSKISRLILAKQYPFIQNNVKELCMYEPTFIMLDEGSISVIAIPAGHCPGSVMFLFENDKCILYTGDFRIDGSDIKKFNPLYDKFGKLKTIHKLYLDTTFFTQKYLRFPKREESVEEICRIIKDWTAISENFTVNLITSAKYGYEFLFIEIFKRLGMAIHVCENIYNFYSLIPDMDKAVTLDKSATQIHSHCGNNFKQVCDKCNSQNTKSIRISALRWHYNDLEEQGISERGNDDFEHFICYSTHCSYEEVLEVIKFLKPIEIEICVKQRDPQDNRQMLNTIRSLLDDESKSRETVEDDKPPKLFVINTKSKKSYDDIQMSYFNDTLGILDSPPLFMEDEEVNKQKETFHQRNICSKKHQQDSISSQSVEVVHADIKTANNPDNHPRQFNSPSTSNRASIENIVNEENSLADQLLSIIHEEPNKNSSVLASRYAEVQEEDQLLLDIINDEPHVKKKR